MQCNVDYLRVSVTDRCNLRCSYCNPMSFHGERKIADLLTVDEIRYIAGLLIKCGINKVRLTGGEPLLRADIPGMVHAMSMIDGITDLSVTTNGVLLESLADELKSAGLHRVNISVDSTNRENYRRITGFDLLPEVLKGINKALDVGLNPVKLNSVIIKGVNSSTEEITSLARLSVALPVIVRFIEYCPTNYFPGSADGFVPNSEVRKIIEDEFGRLGDAAPITGSGPAVYFKINNASGAVGFISGMTSMLCHECNRLRLTCDGKFTPCLYSSKRYDLRALLENQADDDVMARFIGRIIREKRNYTRVNRDWKEFSMQRIGG
jgi:cyclic pyranopterin phosphate synthase